MKTVLITGASKGIGLACVEKFCKENYAVIACARHPEKSYALKTLSNTHKNLTLLKLDVTDSPQNIQMIINDIGTIDILINNAGIGLFGPVETATDAETRQIFGTNVFGFLNVLHSILPSMRKKNSGHIITISSVAGPVPSPNLPGYSASKAAIETYMSALRHDLKTAGFNIKVSNIQPGPVQTDFESSTPNGSRFSDDENPYPQMKTGRDAWTRNMKNGALPDEIAEVVFKVANQDNPNYWNPTSQNVLEQFERIYKDITGNDYILRLKNSNS